MITLGIDPGSRRVGYGIIKKTGNRSMFIDAGILSIKSRNDQGALFEIKKQVDALIEKYKPDAIGIERLYVTKNQKTGVQTAQARGVILLAAVESKTPVREFSPNEVKANIAGYGLADKRAVAKMVRLILRTPGLRLIDDATDALALAVTTSQFSQAVTVVD